MHARQRKTLRRPGPAAILATAAIAVSLFTLAPPLAYAQESSDVYTIEQNTADLPGERGTNCGYNLASADFYVCAFLKTILTLVSSIMQFIFWIADVFFVWAMDLNISFLRSDRSTAIFVKSGYPLVLSAANMFFVLILLWIAIATIFNFETYSARSLLPRLIIMALLINFSLPIGRAFINLSNGIANIFYSDLAAGSGGVSRSLREALRVEELLYASTNPTYNELCRDAKDTAACAQRIAQVASKTFIASDGATKTITAAQCDVRGPVIAPEGICRNLISETRQQALLAAIGKGSITTILALAIGWNLIVYPIAIFVLFAAAILLFMRIVSLSFVLVLGPAAFLFGILPTTRSLFTMWWDRLAKWSFFFPAFLFLFWLSVKAMANISGEFAATSGGVDVFGTFIALLLAVAFMIASLMIATSFSIQGASTVTGWGKKLAGAAGTWTKGTALRGIGKVAEGVLGAAGIRNLAESRATRWMLRPVEAAAAAGRKVEETRSKAALQRRQFAAKAAPAYQAAIMKSMRGGERADFVKATKERDLKRILGTMDHADRVQLYNDMKAFDLEEKILKSAPDITVRVEMETGTRRDDGQFQKMFSNWLATASREDIRETITAGDIYGPNANAHLRHAILNDVDYRTLQHLTSTFEAAGAMREFFIDIDVGNVNVPQEERGRLRETYRPLAAATADPGSAAQVIIPQAINILARSNPTLARAIGPVQINLAHGRPLQRKQRQPPQPGGELEPPGGGQPPGGGPPPAGGTTP